VFIQALKALEQYPTPKSRQALTSTIENEKCFYLIRIDAAKSLAKVPAALHCCRSSSDVLSVLWRLCIICFICLSVLLHTKLWMNFYDCPFIAERGIYAVGSCHRWFCLCICLSMCLGWLARQRHNGVATDFVVKWKLWKGRVYEMKQLVSCWIISFEILIFVFPCIALLWQFLSRV